MPIKTPRIGIPYFGRGDLYSAQTDAVRMSIIDSQMYAMAEILGDGIINGLAVSQTGDTTVSISPGMALFDGKVFRLSYSYNLNCNTDGKVYIRKRREYGGFGLFGIPIQVNNAVNPSVIQLNASVEINEENKVEISWERPAWCEFVRLYRSISGGSQQLVGLAYGNSLIDVDAPRGYEIEYFISPVQFGNIVVGTESVGTVSTPPSSDPPPLLNNISVGSTHRGIFIHWDTPVDFRISNADIKVRLGESEIFNIEIPASSGFCSFSGLETNTTYFLDINTVSFSGVESVIRTLSGFASFSQGPLSPLQPTASLQLDKVTLLSLIKVNWINPVTSPEDADPECPGQIDDASGNFAASTYVKIDEISGDGVTVLFSGEEFVSQSTSEASILNIKYRSISGELLTRNLQGNTRYIVQLRRSVNGRFSPPVKVALRTGSMGELVAPSSGSVVIKDNASISAVWSASSNSSALFYRLSLDSAPIVSRVRIYDEVPKETFGITRTPVNVFDFIVFDISKNKLIIRIKNTTQLNNLPSLVILRQYTEFIFTEGMTIADLDAFFKNPMPMFSVAGIVFTLNQLFGTVSSDMSKSIFDFVEAFDVSPTFGSDGPASYDPNDTNMSLIKYYVSYYGGIAFYAVSDISTSTYRDDVQLGEFEPVVFGINGEYEAEVSGTLYESNKELAAAGKRYRFTVKSVDSQGRESPGFSFYGDSPLPFEVPNPADPEIVHAEVQGGSIQLLWTPSIYPVKEYKIFRKLGNGNFIHIGSITGDYNTYIDIGIPVDTSIIYVVKSVNAWNSMSLAPDSQNYVTMPHAKTRIVGADFNNSSITVSVVQSGYNANVSWTASDEPTDGYEIWVKRPGKSFEIVGTVSAEIFSFVHQNGLVQDGAYSYSVRPVRGELEVNFASLINVPSDAFSLASIFFNEQGEMQIEIGLRVLTGGLDLVKDPLMARIDEHRHLLLPDGQDRRIDFNEYFDISEFVSLGDGFRFTRVSEHPKIPDSAELNVYINGNKYLGQFSYDEYLRTILFSNNILPPFGPFENIESLVLRVSNISETENSLPEERMMEVFGEQMSSGVLFRDLTPSRSHVGRRKEKCIPLKCPASSLDGFKFVISKNEYGKTRYFGGEYIELGPNDNPPANFENFNIVPYPFGQYSHTIVYDGCELSPDDSLLLATSVGLMQVTKINTNLKSEIYIPCLPPMDSGPPIKIAVSNDRKYILVAYPKAVDLLSYIQDETSPDGNRKLNVLQNAIGRDYGIKFIRDICPHKNGFFASTDLGPMFIDKDETGSLSITLTSLPDSDNTETYSCLSINDEIYVSVQSGIFKSTDDGNNWSLFATPPLPARQMRFYQNKIFALSEEGVYRIDIFSRNIEEIHRNENSRYRRMEIFKDQMILIGDVGCMISKQVYSLVFSNEIIFVQSKSLPKFSKKTRVPRSVFRYRGDVCIGGDSFVSRANVLTRIKGMIDFSNDLPTNERSKIPSVFINGTYIDNGTYLEYGLDRNVADVFFVDDQVEGDYVVEVARQYTDMHAQNGGWAWRDFAAPVVVSVNSMPINEGSRAEKPVDQILEFVAIDRQFADIFSRSVEANNDYGVLRSIVSEMTNNDREITNNPQSVGVHRFTRANVRRYVNALNNLNSKIYSDKAMSMIGTRSSLVLKSPEFRTNLIANFVTNGVTSTNLDSRSISYSPYIDETCVGSLGTFDIEDTMLLSGELRIGTPRDGTDNPNYPSSFNEGSVTRPGIPDPTDSIFVGGYFGRDRCMNAECITLGQFYIPRPAGSINVFGGDGSTSSSSSVSPPPGGDIGGGGGVAG